MQETDHTEVYRYFFKDGFTKNFQEDPTVEPGDKRFREGKEKR